MTTYNKTSLKTFFETLDIPQGSDYANLIDSQVNLVETTEQTMAGPLYTTKLITPRVSAAAANITGIMSAGTFSVNNLIVTTVSASSASLASMNVGAAATNLSVNTTGDTFWVGAGTGVPYGCFGAENMSDVVVVSAQSATQIVQVSGMVAGPTNLMSFTNYYLEVTKAGMYKTTWSLSLDASAAAQIEGGIAVNNVALPSLGTAHGYVAVGDLATCIAGTAIVSCAASAKLALYVRNQTGAANITIEHVSFTAEMIGGV